MKKILLTGLGTVRTIKETARCCVKKIVELNLENNFMKIKKEKLF